MNLECTMCPRLIYSYTYYDNESIKRVLSGIDHPSKVHFDDGQAALQNSEIVVKQESPSTIAVHLGFLQLNHVYDVTFSIKDDLSEDLQSDPLGNLYVKVLEVMPSEDGRSCCRFKQFCIYLLS